MVACVLFVYGNDAKMNAIIITSPFLHLLVYNNYNDTYFMMHCFYPNPIEFNFH